MTVKEILEVATEFEEVYVSDSSIADGRCPLAPLRVCGVCVGFTFDYYGDKEVAKIQVPENYPELLIIHIKKA